MTVSKKKIYDIILQGDVQEVGFRNYIVGVAKKRGISAYPWNEDGNLRVLYKGETESLKDFLLAIKTYELADITDLEVKEVRRLRDVPLPPEPRMVVGADVLEEIYKALAVGVKYLQCLPSIDKKLNHLGDRLSQETRSMGETLGGKIDAMGETLGGKIDAMGETLGKKIDKSTREQMKYNKEVTKILKELTKGKKSKKRS